MVDRTHLSPHTKCWRWSTFGGIFINKRPSSLWGSRRTPFGEISRPHHVISVVKNAYRWVPTNTVLLSYVKYRTKSFQKALWSCTMQQNVVQPIQDCWLKVVGEDLGDCLLQVRDGVGPSLKHTFRYAFPIRGYEGLTFERSLIQFKLTIWMRKIERGVLWRWTQLDQLLF